MLNPNNLSTLIHKVLSTMGIREPAMDRLIKGTFLAQSDLEMLFDYSNHFNPEHGLMLLDEKRLKVLFEKIKYNRNFQTKILDVTGIDITDISFHYFVLELDVNINLMIAITYCFYANLYQDFPSDDLSSIARFYRECWVRSDDDSLDAEFIELYKEVYVSD